jgi:hypothetical protein
MLANLCDGLIEPPLTGKLGGDGRQDRVGVDPLDEMSAGRTEEAIWARFHVASSRLQYISRALKKLRIHLELHRLEQRLQTGAHPMKVTKVIFQTDVGVAPSANDDLLTPNLAERRGGFQQANRTRHLHPELVKVRSRDLYGDGEHQLPPVDLPALIRVTDIAICRLPKLPDRRG